MPAEIVDPFYRALSHLVTEKMSERAAQLVGGSARRSYNDAETVGEKYAAQVSYIQALQDVLTWCAAIEHARYGDGKQREDI